MNQRTQKTKSLVLTGVLTAIMLIMTSIPFLGYIPVGPIRATLVHIPVIIGAILLGPKYGAFLGFVFGSISLWMSTFAPTILSFAFSPFYSAGDGLKGNPFSLIVCFLPRILIGIVSYYIFLLVKKILKHKKHSETIALIAAGLAGSLTNTILVMNLIYLIFQDSYAIVKDVPVSALYNVIMVVIMTNGIPEAIAGAIITAAIGKILLRF